MPSYNNTSSSLWASTTTTTFSPSHVSTGDLVTIDNNGYVIRTGTSTNSPTYVIGIDSAKDTIPLFFGPNTYSGYNYVVVTEETAEERTAREREEARLERIRERNAMIEEEFGRFGEI